ncbi:MAG: ABC transporter permease [Bacteroidia bacterium]|nr:ABC transporter permease [Bacteroidia bacterium]
MGYIFHNFLNTLKRYKASSVLNVLGMAVAFASFYLIMTQISYDFRYNKAIPDSERIYVLTTPSEYDPGKYDSFMCRPLGESLVTDIASVEKGGLVCMYDFDQSRYIKDGNGAYVRIPSVRENRVSPEGIGTFGIEILSGSMDDLTGSDKAFISESFARKYSLEIGDMLFWNPDSQSGFETVVGIYRDFPEATDLEEADVLTGIGNESIDSYSEWSYVYFVKLRKGTDPTQFEQDAVPSLKKVLLDIGHEENSEDMEEALSQLKVHIVPFEDLYYTKELRNSVGRSGNLSSDIAMFSVAILIILIAVINFINFFFAMVPVRLKSVNTYKIFGVSRASLVWNFVSEAIGLTVLALLLASVLVWAFLISPSSSILSSSALPAKNVGILLMTAGIALAASAAGSVYPAFYITSFQPALALKGSFGSSRSGRRLRMLLVGVQFVISTALIICAMFISAQQRYVMNYDMGFDKAQLYCAEIPRKLAWNKGPNESFESRLKSSPLVKDIAWADGQLVHASRMGWGRTYDGRDVHFQCYPVSYNFLSFMGIDVVEGRDFVLSDELSENGVMIFNREAQKQFDIDIEKPGPGHKGTNAVVAGICEDFHYKPLQYGNAPFAFYVFGKDSWRSALTRMYLRAAEGADPKQVISLVRDTVLEMSPSTDPETVNVELFDKELGRQYAKEQRLGNLITLLTLIAIIISLMGVFGLVLFETQHRSKEIAVRRVHGAEISDILKMLNSRFIAIVFVCFAVAAPLSYVVISRYFSTFAYHAPLYWWVFLAALLAVLCLTVGIVTLRSWSAATANPVEKLKTE